MDNGRNNEKIFQSNRTSLSSIEKTYFEQYSLFLELDYHMAIVFSKYDSSKITDLVLMNELMNFIVENIFISTIYFCFTSF